MGNDSLQNDSDVTKSGTREGRKNTFKDKPDEGLDVVVDLRHKISEQLVAKLEDQGTARKIVDVWKQADADRTQMMNRQRDFLEQFDEFVDPIYKPATNWGSVLHMPTTLTACKTYHARFNSALTTPDPMFTVRARTEANVDRAKLVEKLMQYTIDDWVNEGSGMKDTIDDWLWDWITTGTGILKASWKRKFTRFQDVEDVPFQETTLKVNPQGQDQVVSEPKSTQEIRTREIKTFDGPMAEKVNLEDIVIVGGNGDPQKADFVIQQSFLTASDLWQLVDQGIFRKEAVETVINSGEDSQSADNNALLKQERKDNAGLADVDRKFDLDRYQILEAYVSMDVDGSGINSEIVVWLHRKTKEILRATYLYRVMPTGQRPFFVIHFYRRQDSEYGVGLVELMYSLSKEIDAIHNMRVDTGIITSLPWGVYRPVSSMSAEKYQIEPGALLPVENPQTDINFPNLGNRTTFGFQEEQVLQGYLERLTSISDINLGANTGTQGALRTATGTRALVGETNANLDIFLQRLNRGWKPFLKYLFNLLQQHMPPGKDFRVLGDDGNQYWQRVEKREELQGSFDFEIDGNSANTNKLVQVEQADITFQISQNPILLQMGIVNSLNIYNAAKEVLKVRGIKQVSKYLTRPDQIARVFTPIEIMNRLLSGIDVPLDPTQDLTGFITLVAEVLRDDETLGQFSQPEVAALIQKRNEAAQLQKALQAAEAQAANIQQQQINTQQGVAGQSFEQQQPIGALSTPRGAEGV